MVVCVGDDLRYFYGLYFRVFSREETTEVFVLRSD